MADDRTLHTGKLDLESHGAFVRAVAAQLLGGAEQSKDVAQEALLAAVQANGKGQIPVTSVKGWLAKIVSRTAFRGVRLERARWDRERGYGRELLERHTVASPEQESVRAETIRTVMEAVLSLREPYLQTVLLRFYEDKDAHQIARIMGVPVATVRSRLQRAQGQLQQKLEPEFGGSFEGLSLALLPMLANRSWGWAPAAAGASLIGKITMGMKAKSAWAGVGLVGFLGLYATEFGGLIADRDGQVQEAPSGQGLGPVGAQTSDPKLTTAQGIEVRSREAVVEMDSIQPDPEWPVFPKSGLFGRVLYQGQPLAGVEVTQYRVEIHRLSDFRTDQDVVGRIRPIDREIRRGQWGFTTSGVTCVDPGLDGVLPEDVRTFKPVEGTPVAVTGSDGRFEFAKFPNKPLSLVLRHAELDLALLSEPILPNSAELWDAGDLAMQPAVTLVGNLTFDHALELAGHTTTIGGLPGYSATSDARGRFEIPGIPWGEYVLNVDLGPGVYRPKWDQGFFVRLGKHPMREVTLATQSKPCSQLSVQVTHNGEPFADESLELLVRGMEESCTIYLNGEGKGIGTVPSNVALQPTARFGSYSDGVSIGEDLFLNRREHSAKWNIQSGSLDLEFPYTCIPKPETCLVNVQTEIEGARAVRFDQVFGSEGHAVELDSLGSARVRVPAWMTVEPCFQNARGTWIHVETLDVMFPSGDAEFRMAWDKGRGGVALTGHNPKLRKQTKKRARQYRMQLQWTHPVTQDVETENRSINPGRVAAAPAQFETIRFPGLPVGPMDLSVHLQRKGSEWKTLRTWTKSIHVQAGEVGTPVSLEE